MLMMALQKGGEPVPSGVMAEILGVSDSYLKKTLRKLAAAELVESSAQRGGGFRLSKPAERITVADACRALHAKTGPELSDLPDRVFPDKAHTAKVKASLLEAVNEAEEAYLERLAAISLSDLLVPESARKGGIDWRCFQHRAK